MIGACARLGPGLVLLAAMAAGCSGTSGPQAASRPIRSDRVLDFSVLYGRNCAGCHGADGQFGPSLPLNDPTFLAIVPDEVLRRLVAEGRPGTPMPAFSRKKGGPLTDAQVEALASGIKRRWKAEAQESSPPAYALTEGRGDPERGAGVFEMACAPCHGPDGRGGEGKVGPIHEPSFLALISDQAIRRTIITGRRDLKMPDFAGKDGRGSDFTPLTPADVADLVALVSGWRAQDESRGTE